MKRPQTKGSYHEAIPSY